MKCTKCKKDFDKSQLGYAKDVNGNYPKKGSLYCATCAEEEYQRKLLVELLHRAFIANGYYNDPDYDNSKFNKAKKNRLMTLVNTQISNLCKDSYTYNQIRCILEYMMTYENVSISDTIIGLVPYYYIKTKRYHDDLFRIATSKTYGYIKPEEYVEYNKPPHKPNKKALNLTSMESV